MTLLTCLLVVVTLCASGRGDPAVDDPLPAGRAVIPVTVIPVASLGLLHELHPSYHVDGSQHLGYNDLTSNIFDRHDVFVQHLRKKRATGFSYTTPDSSRSEQFDTYTDPRTRDNHPLNRYQGRVCWQSPEGIPFCTEYVADGGGFHPSGAHLPGSPGHRSFFIGSKSS